MKRWYGMERVRYLALTRNHCHLIQSTSEVQGNILLLQATEVDITHGESYNFRRHNQNGPLPQIASLRLQSASTRPNLRR